MAESALLLADLVAAEPQPPRWSIPNFAQRGRLTTFFANVNSGKTTVYQHAIAAHTQGEDFLGMYPFTEPQVFLVCDWENSKEDVGQSLRRLGADVTATSLRYFSHPDGWHLDTESGRDKLRQYVQAEGITCAIFDNRDAAFPNTPENDGDKVCPAVQAVRRLAEELDIAIVLISHEPKGGNYGFGLENLRGHSGWGMFSDQMFRLCRKRKSSDPRELQHVKHRGMTTPRPPIAVRLTSSGDPETGPLTLIGTLVGQAKRQDEKNELLIADIAVAEGFLGSHGPTAPGSLRHAMQEAGINKARQDRVLAAAKAKEGGRTRIHQPNGARTPYELKEDHQA